jgi:hypothetical protein
VNIARDFAACYASTTTEQLHSRRISSNESSIRRLNCADPPLSWKLTQDQKDCIDYTWNDFGRQDPNGALEKIREFLDGSQE